MYILSLSAFDVANAWELYIPYLLLIAVLVFIVGVLVVSLFAGRSARKDQSQPEAKEPEQAARSQTDDKQ